MPVTSLGFPVLNLENFEGAVRAFEAVLETDFGNLDALYMKSLSLLRSGRYEESASGFREVLKRDPVQC